tara:strand:- start:189 stop:1073 length:885 start_codon:yes stop_codon:yes gene_type:complete
MKVQFGHIPGTKIGQLFKDRTALKNAGIHANTVKGIWGAGTGACSIVLSGGYPDDKDFLEYIIYTGFGGQDPKTKKQIKNQEFIGGNKGLMISCEYKFPVRVTRGKQIPNGPKEGYRYDGLYYVEKYEYLTGVEGFKMCRFHLRSDQKLSNLENSLVNTFKENYISPKRENIKINKIKRDPEIAERVKTIYDFKCQVCGIRLDTPSKRPIAIGAHIKGLGFPHNGPDVIENMLCLCPNHHDQFDKYSFSIDPKDFRIIGLKGFENRKLKVDKRHKIDKLFLKYQQNDFLKENAL